MTKSETLRRIAQTGIVPVVRAPSGDEALRVVDAIRDGGIDVIELTMTVPRAVALIEQLAGRYGDEVVLGAGTVLDAETARSCMVAGASFVVSPVLDPGTVACCRTHGVPVLPGALTPTEVLSAWRLGADIVKVFPCSAVGGASYIKALKAPLPQIELLPTGGVSLTTVADFIRAGSIAVGAGADLVDLAKIRAGNARAVTDQARRYLESIRQARAEGQSSGGARP
jgi:2-dehydro-3-deoxyphosphogluconate aldolase/(4S)-4-hydroxy-2-oxoglutarate aldolase